LFLSVALFYGRADNYCLTGAFLADNPAVKDIIAFKQNFGKKSYLIMVYVSWGNFPQELTVKDVYSQGCVLVVTWEALAAAIRRRHRL